MKLHTVFVGLSFLCLAAAYKSYDGYKLFRTKALAAADKAKIELLMQRPEFDFWNVPRTGRQVDIMTGPEHVQELEFTLQRMGLIPEVINNNVGDSIKKERQEIENMRKMEMAQKKAPSFDRYLDFDELMAYLDSVVATYPEIASIIEIGTSYEGRPLRVLKLSNGAGKPGIFFDTVLHAREWIGPPTSLYAINELTENLANNQALLDNSDWYFLLVANPDGFAFSWTDDRLWRKTRSDNNGEFCKGVDPNRNFDYAWSAQGTVCELTYPGLAANSEVEVKALSDYLLATPSITGYIAVHSYGKYLLHPYGDRTEDPPNVDELTRIGNAAANALSAVDGTIYTVGSTYDALYKALGISVDWAFDKAGISLAYTIELRGDNGGFNPPASLIMPSNVETWEAYKVLASNLPATRSKIH